MSTLRKKRVSKKNKKSWRKNVNINDVEEFLEDQRLEERLGLSLGDLKNEELFQLDSKPVKQIALEVKRKRREIKPLKCFSLLNSHTNVPDPISKRNYKKNQADNEKSYKKKHLKNSQIKRMDLEHSEKDETQLSIWADCKIKDECNGWLPKTTIKHNTSGITKLKKQPKSTILLPSIDVPHPGMSYNPSYGDHQELLKLVADREMTIIKENKHLDRVTKNLFSRVTKNERDGTWLTEMSQGLPSASTKTETESDSDGDYKSINPPTKNKKKSLQQRRRHMLQLETEMINKKNKINRKKISELHHLKHLTRSLDKREAKLLIGREKRSQLKLLKAKATKRLNALKFEETELEFNLGSDLTGKLRNLKMEGNLLNDRFKSLQKRNIIAPTVRGHRKRPKVKVYTKPGHKCDWITTVARSKQVSISN